MCKKLEWGGNKRYYMINLIHDLLPLYEQDLIIYFPNSDRLLTPKAADLFLFKIITNDELVDLLEKSKKV